MKSKNIIIFAVIILAIIIGLGFLGSQSGGGLSKKASIASASILSALEKDFDFGTIAMKNGNVSKVFELKNDGAEPIVINKVYTSCMCTTAEITDAKGETSGPYGMPGHGGGISTANVKVGAGETIKVKAIFNPAAHGPSGIGLANRTVFIETNSSQTPKVELNFRAMVTN
ncbi:MAG: DUF1573 domain-containing protein [Nitrospirae bacterium]|nr:DUF1573 domain-containing protein [Nitrospirota bacterium]MBI3589276.1 DUF1573 domain-containing protein [Candidatus Liptonbacteria bacterium]